MGSGTTAQWTVVERWSPILFLVGGSLMVGHAAMLGIQAFSNLATPPDVFGPAGHLIALLGLFGFYPALVDRTPAVARVAGPVGAVALGAWTVVAVARGLSVVGIIPSPGDVLPGAFFMLVFASTILAYVLFGVAVRRIDGRSRLVGLLLAPAVLILVALVGSAIAGVTAVGGLVIGSGLALSTLAVGHTLRTWDRPTDRGVPAGDATVG